MKWIYNYQLFRLNILNDDFNLLLYIQVGLKYRKREREREKEREREREREGGR